METDRQVGGQIKRQLFSFHFLTVLPFSFSIHRSSEYTFLTFSFLLPFPIFIPYPPRPGVAGSFSTASSIQLDGGFHQSSSLLRLQRWRSRGSREARLDECQHSARLRSPYQLPLLHLRLPTRYVLRTVSSRRGENKADRHRLRARYLQTA